MKNLQRYISSFLKYFSVILLLQNIGVVATGCKTMNLLQKKPGSYLRNHVIQSVTVSSEPMCRVMCYLNDSCLSYNFHEGTGKCEINNSDELQHPDDLIPNAEYLYRGTKNDCKDHTCPSNSTCQPKFTNEGGYYCLCPSGFTGTNCEADIDECQMVAICPINTKCKNSIGSFHCFPLGTQENPAKSCLDILGSGYSNGSAEYWLDPIKTGNPMKALCDMTTEGGGWTVVKKLVQPSNTPLTPFKPTTYEVIKEYNRTDMNVMPMGAAMLDLKNKMGFQQIHFYCHKVSVGRVVSIMTRNDTAGQAVVGYFTTPGAASSLPAACGSFYRLPDDTSVISQECNKWGDDPPNQKWGASCCSGPMRIAARPFQIATPPSRGFEFVQFFLCDNDIPSGASFAAPPDVNDTWQISVR